MKRVSCGDVIKAIDRDVHCCDSCHEDNVADSLPLTDWEMLDASGQPVYLTMCCTVYNAAIDKWGMGAIQDDKLLPWVMEVPNETDQHAGD